MTEKEILEKQEASGNQVFYLMLVGKFFLAYGYGAFALSRGTGYRVMRKARKMGSVITCGFPIERLDTVLLRVRDAGGRIEPLEQRLYRFSGLDGTPDERMVCEQKPVPATGKTAAPEGMASRQSAPPPFSGGDWLREAVLSFNLSMSTPLDAMNFIGRLQQKLKTSIACESPAGQGLQE